MRKRFWIPAAIAVVTMVVPVTADAATTPNTLPINSETRICDQLGTGLCLQTAGSGHDVFMSGAGSASKFDVVPVQGPDGVTRVSTSHQWPFNNTTDNSRYSGDRVVQIHYSGGGCVRDAYSRNNLLVDPCRDRGTNWVLDSNSIVDVYMTNFGDHVGLVATGQAGSGSNALLQLWHRGYSQWSDHHS